jgi:uncharacterized protein with GYD domain
MNFTERGIKSFGGTVKRAEAFAELVKQHGGNVKAIYWTLGQYDLVAVIEGLDDENATAAALHLGSMRNVRTVTMRAFDAEEMTRIIAKAGMTDSG